MKKIISFSSLLSLVLVSTTVISCSHKIDYNNTSNNSNLKGYYDDRDVQQKTNQANIDKNVSKEEINPNKKVILVGLDGTISDNFEKYVAKQKLNNNFYKYNIQNYDSGAGWGSILYGNIKKYGKNIFNVVKDFSDAKNEGLKTASALNWEGIKKWSIYKKDWKYIDDLIEYSEVHNKNFGVRKTDNIEDEKKVFNNEVLPAMEEKFNHIKDWNKSGKYNLIWHYDTSADDAGHSNYKYDSFMVQNIYNEYNKFFDFYNSEEINKNTLVIMTTDHGRDSEGLNHKENSKDIIDIKKSWTYFNKDITTFSSIKYKNFYDIKTIIYDWLKK